MINTVEDLIVELTKYLDHNEFTHVHIGYDGINPHLADIDVDRIVYAHEHKTIIINGKEQLTKFVRDVNTWKSITNSELIELLKPYSHYRLLGKCNYPFYNEDTITNNDEEFEYKQMDCLKVHSVNHYCVKNNNPIYSTFIVLDNLDNYF